MISWPIDRSHSTFMIPFDRPGEADYSNVTIGSRTPFPPQPAAN